MHKRRTGLQKEISRIFTGIQIPRKDVPEAGTRPAAPAPAKYIPPKPVAPAPAPAPRPFTIPEPSQYTPLPKQTTYEPPKQTTYEPPKQTIYESLALTPIVRQPQPEPVTKPHRQMPLLKIWGQISARLLAPKPGVDPRRQKLMVLMMVALSVVFVVVLARVLRTPARSAAKPTNKSASSDVAVFNGKINWELPAPYPETLRDPMTFGAVATQTQEDTSKPMVKGIVYSEDNPCAVVGDRIVSAGDVVQGATVVKINRDSVEFAIGDKNWTQKVER